MKIVSRDIVGKKFGSLTVTGEYKQVGECPNRKTYWLCRCDCGNEFWINRYSIVHRRQNYCEKCKPAGVRNNPLYHIYHGIKQRCYNPKNPRYEHYGGKGVVMCDEWLNGGFSAFEEWALSNGYKAGANLSVDRINSCGNYCPENCEWVTVSENTRRGDIGRAKAHTKLQYVYVIKPNGERENITNISQFSRDNNLLRSNVSAAIHGRIKNTYRGYEFHSNKID